MKEGARLVAARGRLMQGLPAGGEMMTVGAGEREVEEELEGYQGKVVIAAVNAEDAVVIAGEKEEVREVGERLEKKGIRVKRLEVSHAFHSARMEPMMEEYRREAEKIEYGKKKIPMVSTVSGREAGEEVETAEYWVRQVREAVRFWEATKTLKREGVEEYLEVGPRGVLVGLIRESGGEAEPVRLASMRSGRGESEGMLEALGGYYVGGGEVEWKGVMGGEGKRIELPTYPWQRSRFWVDAPSGERRGGHPLLGEGRSLSTLGGVRLWETRLTAGRPRWLADHQVAGAVLVPAAGLVEMARAAGAEVLGGAVVVAEVEFVAALVVGESVQVQLVTTTEAQGLRFQVASRAGEEAWTVHARGLVRREDGAAGAVAVDVEGVRARLGAKIAADADGLYDAEGNFTDKARQFDRMSLAAYLKDRGRGVERHRREE
mgnify:CR=1 FL=1